MKITFHLYWKEHNSLIRRIFFSKFLNIVEMTGSNAILCHKSDATGLLINEDAMRGLIPEWINKAKHKDEKELSVIEALKL